MGNERTERLSKEPHSIHLAVMVQELEPRQSESRTKCSTVLYRKSRSGLKQCQKEKTGASNATVGVEDTVYPWILNCPFLLYHKSVLTSATSLVSKLLFLPKLLLAYREPLSSRHPFIPPFLWASAHSQLGSGNSGKAINHCTPSCWDRWRCDLNWPIIEHY